MRFANPIYPITSRKLSGSSHTEQVRSLASSKIDLIQLREKSLSSGEFFDDAKSALEIARASGIKVIVNDRVDIALALKADGVHLGQDDLPPAAARELLHPGAIIGYSTHTLKQVREAAKLPLDYIAFGPVYPTSTKENPDSVTGLELLTEAKKLVGDIPLVAIGGIDEKNIEDILSSGADAAAVISSVWSSSDNFSDAVHNLYTRCVNNIV